MKLIIDLHFALIYLSVARVLLMVRKLTKLDTFYVAHAYILFNGSDDLFITIFSIIG